MEKLYTIDEFLELAPISRDTLYALWTSGAGPAVTRIGRRVFIKATDAQGWLDEISGHSWKASRAERQFEGRAHVG